MKRTRQKRTAKVILTALLSVVMVLAMIFAILSATTLPAHADSVEDAADDAAAANAVKDLIDAIGEVELTLNSKAQIDAARTAYEALDEKDQKPLVTNLGVLEAAEARYEELVAIDRVENLIDEIGTVEYTDESALKIETAKKAFGELTEEQQAQVANADDLTAARAAFKALDDAAKAKFVSDLIAQIGTVAYTDECREKIDEAEDALARLTDEQKPLVENADDLTAAKNTYAALKADYEAAEAVKAQIAAIGTVEYTAESKAKIDAAKAAYEALTPAQKELVSNYSVLTVAEQTYAEKETEATAKKGLPGGVVALIVILCVLVVCCGGFAIFWFVVKKNSWAAFVELVKACCGKVAAFFRNLFKKK